MIDHDIVDKICHIIVHDLKWPVSEVDLNHDTHLGEQGLAFDSIMTIQLAVQLEERLGVQIPEDEMMDLTGKTIGETATYVENVRSSTHPEPSAGI